MMPLSRQKQSGVRTNNLVLPTTAFEAQRLEKAVLTYDFIFLLIGMAATLLFVFETLYRVYTLYETTNGRRSYNSSKRRKKRRRRNFNCDENDLCHNISHQISACHDLYNC